jgi:long-chain fatty acid transport protein
MRPAANEHALPLILATALVIALTVSTPSLATNGYSPTGFGTANKGLVGAGVALPQDTLAAATNPAGMALLGHRLDVGAALFNPNHGFTANDDAQTPPFPSVPPGRYESQNDLFLVPHFGWNRPLDDKSSFGVSIGGNGGMNTDYDAAVWRNFNNPAGSASSPTGVDFAQLFVGVTYAREVAPGHYLGITPILAAQRFRAEGLEPFQGLSTSPTRVTNKGYDYAWGYGLRIGWLGQVSDRLTLGASAQTRLEMTRFKDYEGLFAEQGDFDTPATITAGLAYQVTPAVTLVFDWQRIFYGNVKALGNSNNLALGPGNLLGADDGLGFGWDDINIYKLGVQWEYSPQWTFRAGYSHADQLFENGESLFNVLAPATIQSHASLGLTYDIDKRNSVSVAYTRAFPNKIRGANANFTGPQTGHVQMDQHELEVSWGIRFD